MSEYDANRNSFESYEMKQIKIREERRGKLTLGHVVKMSLCVAGVLIADWLLLG